MSVQTPQAATFQLVPYEQKWVESLNRGDVAAADEVFAADCVIHITGGKQPDLSVADFKEMLRAFLAAFPDLHFSIEDQLIDGDKVALRWMATGTHTAPLGVIPATGKRILLNGLILQHVANGQIVERWEQWDHTSLLAQLGLM